MRRSISIMRTTGVILLVIYFLCGVAIFAQENDGVEQRVSEFQKELKLSEEQTAQIRQILLYDQKQAQQEMEQNKGDAEALRNAARARREMTDQQIKNMLTSEQYQKYQEMNRNRISDKMALDLKERLNLTDEQAKKVEQIMDSTRQEMQELRDNASGDRSQMREQMMALRDKQDKQIEALLTDEQKKAYDEYKKERQQERRNRMQGWRNEGKRPR